jgi:hypothetical protein
LIDAFRTGCELEQAKESNMTDVLSHSSRATIRKSEKSYDCAILVSVALLAIGLIIVLGAARFPGATDPINPDLVIAYP